MDGIFIFIFIHKELYTHFPDGIRENGFVPRRTLTTMRMSFHKIRLAQRSTLQQIATVAAISTLWSISSVPTNQPYYALPNLRDGKENRHKIKREVVENVHERDLSSGMYSNGFHAISFAQKANFTCACGWATFRLLSDGRTTRMASSAHDMNKFWRCFTALDVCWCRVASSRRLCVWAALNFTAIYSLRFALISTQSIIFTYATHGRRGKKCSAPFAHVGDSRLCVCVSVCAAWKWRTQFLKWIWCNGEMGKHTMIQSFTEFGEWKLRRHRSTRLHTNAFSCSQHYSLHWMTETNTELNPVILGHHLRSYAQITAFTVARIIFAQNGLWPGLPSYSACIPMRCVRVCVECDHHRRCRHLLVLLCQKLRMCVPD